ncbi:MAG: three-Cys-motif partner protein TcmP [Ignavibacterium sp.]|jgi:three-Cys-motif partner protein
MKEHKLLWKEDGLKTLDVGPWVLQKYGPLLKYLEMFSTGMKGKWEKRAYVDLYSGPGVVRIRNTGRLLRGSPLLALGVEDTFDKYVFCEEDEESFHALSQRIKRDFNHCDVALINGDCNERIDEIISAIPPYSQTQRVLSFCFADPFSLELQFKTIEHLASRFVDFLVLLALDMDANRNIANYMSKRNTKVNLFLGDHSWRDKWIAYSRTDDSFQRFLAREFENQMLKLGYERALSGNTIRVTTNDRNLPLYHLAFFSRHQKGYQFWKEVRKYLSNPTLFDN